MAIKKKSGSKKTAKPARKAQTQAAAKRKAAPNAGKAKAKKAPKPAPIEQPKPELPWRLPLAGETKIGVVDDYYGHLSVIVFTLESPLAGGDKIHVRGHTIDLPQTVESIQVDHASVPRAEAGAAVGIKVSDKCRNGDYIFRMGA